MIQMEVVTINDENNKKKAGYYISDNLSLFYNKYIADDFEEKYVPLQFEDIAKQYRIRKKYYYDDQKTHTNGEFDIVTVSFHCKWKDCAVNGIIYSCIFDNMLPAGTDLHDCERIHRRDPGFCPSDKAGTVCACGRCGQFR